MKKLICKYITLLLAGGGLYVLVELVWRGRSHWTMFLLGGICFVSLGLINEIIPWDGPCGITEVSLAIYWARYARSFLFCGCRWPWPR